MRLYLYYINQLLLHERSRNGHIYYSLNSLNISVGGLQLVLAVTVLGNEGSGRDKSTQNVVNYERNIVERGVAKFDDSQLHLGKDGMYIFCVSVEEDQNLFQHFSSLMPVELQMKSHLNALEAEEKRHVS
jgi:hypothetical protein